MNRRAVLGAPFFIVAISCGPGVSLDPGAHLVLGDGASADAGADAGPSDDAPADVVTDAGPSVDASADVVADSGPNDAPADVVADAGADAGRDSVAPPPPGVFSEFLVHTISALPTSIAAGANGRIWFIESGADKVAWLTSAGTIQEFNLVPDAGANGLVVDGDGNVWLSETNRHVIARMTPQGNLTESPPLDPTDNPFGLAFSRDSYLWFGLGAQRIGRMVPAPDASGNVTEFAFPDSTRPRSVNAFTTGADGNVWFTEQDGNSIGTVDSSGNIAEYPIRTTAADPISITAGPDGKLWFVEFTGNKVGCIDLQGNIEEFPIPSPNAQPFNITAGGDGNLWFTEYSTNCMGQDGASCLGRVTPDGIVTEVVVPTLNAKLRGITSDADGNLWFTEFAVNKIGELRLTSPTQP